MAPAHSPRAPSVPRAGARSFQLLVAAFAAIAVGFLLSTLYSEVRASKIEREAIEIETNSLPSVEHLVAAESALRRLEAATEQYARSAVEERSVDPSTLEAARRDLGRELHAEETTDMYAGEANLTAAADLTLLELDGVVGLLQEVASRDPVAGAAFAEREVRSAIERTDAALDRILALNAAEAHAEVTRIAAVRRGSLHLALGLDFLCLVFSAVAAFVAVRALRRQEEAERAHAAVLEVRAGELEIFANRVAHDLLSPLSALAFTLSAVKRNGARGVSIDEPLQRATACLKRSQRLVDGVLSFARSAASPRPGERASLREAVGGVVEEVRADEATMRSGAEIVVSLPDEEVVVPCAPGILASVLSNLVRNAVKYMGEAEGHGEDDGGADGRLSGGAAKRVTVRALVGVSDVRVEVEDMGPGLAPEVAEHVFEPYFRAPNNVKPGLGLGLATVRRFVDAYRGRAGVSPAAGGGSIFWFELPRVPARVEVAERAIPAGNVVTER